MNNRITLKNVHDELIIPDQPDNMTPTELANFDMKILKSAFTARDHIQKMIQSQKYLESIEKNNIYLTDVKDNYRAFNMEIEKMTREKIKILNNITSYIDNMTQEQQLTNAQMERSLAKQRDILDELKRLERTIE